MIFCISLFLMVQVLTYKRQDISKLLSKIVQDSCIINSHLYFWCCNNCPREFCPMTQLSKQTIVPGDFCTKKLLPIKIFLYLLRLTVKVYYVMRKKDSMNSLHLVSTFSLEISHPLDNCCNITFLGIEFCEPGHYLKSFI